MSVDAINKAFADLISQRAIHHRVGESSDAIRSLRRRLKSGEPISTERKLQLLQKSGWTQSEKVYDRQDLVSLLQFFKKQGVVAKELGEEYIIEKWEKS